MTESESTMSAEEVMRRIAGKLRADMPRDFEDEIGVAKSVTQWSPMGHNPLTKSQYELGEMLQLDDGAFIANAYRAILHRAPDDHAHELLTRLRLGQMTKVEILGNLRFSEEGKRISVHIDGLLLPYRVSLLRKQGAIGQALSWLISIPKNAVWHRRHEWASGKNSADIQSLGKQHNDLATAVHALERRMELVALAAANATESAEKARSHSKQNDDLNTAVHALERRIESVMREVSDAVESAEKAREADKVIERLASVERSLEEYGRERSRIVESQGNLKDRLQQLRSDLHSHLDSLQTEKSKPAMKAAKLGLDGLYVALEDRFRGGRDLIRHRTARHLDFIADKIGSDLSLPVLDLGSGRGEWLELLKERGFRPIGFELNATCVGHSQSIGLDVRATDILEGLKTLPDDSIGAITMLHVVEHLPLDYFVEVLDECMRVLRDGGGLVVETPNPANAVVSQLTFYMDPTHRNPVPSTLLNFIVSARGFSDVTSLDLFESRELPEAPSVPEGPYKDALEVLMRPRREAMDYAVCATKRVVLLAEGVRP